MRVVIEGVEKVQGLTVRVENDEDRQRKERALDGVQALRRIVDFPTRFSTVVHVEKRVGS